MLRVCLFLPSLPLPCFPFFPVLDFVAWSCALVRVSLLIHLVSHIIMSTSRENSVYLAKLAEQAERYEGTHLQESVVTHHQKWLRI